MKKIYITLVLLQVSICVQAQQLLRGKYVLQSKSEVALTLEFDNSGFKLLEDNGMTQKTGAGKYQLKKDSLLLMFEESINKDSSLYEIEYKQGIKSSQTISNVSLQIVDDQSGLPFKHPSVVLRDNQHNPILVSMGDSLGKSNLILYENKFIHSLDISIVGYTPVSIPIKKLMGKNVQISARLKPATRIYIPKGKEAYRVEKINAKTLILQKDGEKLEFVKTQ